MTGYIGIGIHELAAIFRDSGRSVPDQVDICRSMDPQEVVATCRYRFHNRRSFRDS
jgi:hypothetical protein